MDQIRPTEAHHWRFIEWAKKSGIMVNGVGPAKIPGRGIGIIAERPIQVHIYQGVYWI